MTKVTEVSVSTIKETAKNLKLVGIPENVKHSVITKLCNGKETVAFDFSGSENHTLEETLTHLIEIVHDFTISTYLRAEVRRLQMAGGTGI